MGYGTIEMIQYKPPDMNDLYIPKPPLNCAFLLRVCLSFSNIIINMSK